jgi:hypothetical protein
MIEELQDEETLSKTIDNLREKGIPVLITYAKKQGTLDYPLNEESSIEKICQYGIDGIMIETLIDEDVVFDVIDALENNVEKYETTVESKKLSKFEKNENEIRDYIIYNAYRITKELDIKAIVCFTET